MATSILSLQREGGAVRVTWEGDVEEEFNRILLQHSIEGGSYSLTYDETAYTGSGRTYWRISTSVGVGFNSQVKFCAEIFTMWGKHYVNYLTLSSGKRSTSKTFYH